MKRTLLALAALAVFATSSFAESKFDSNTGSPAARANVGSFSEIQRIERGGAAGNVISSGELADSIGRFIALRAPYSGDEGNEGVLLAKAGTFSFAANEMIELQFAGRQNITGLLVQPSDLDALIATRNAVLSPGGFVVMTVQSEQELKVGAIKSASNVSANRISERGGRILLEVGKF